MTMFVQPFICFTHSPSFFRILMPFRPFYSTFKPSRMRTTPSTEKRMIISRKKMGPSELETHDPSFPVQLLFQNPPFTNNAYARYIKHRQPERSGSKLTDITDHHSLTVLICSRLSYRH